MLHCVSRHTVSSFAGVRQGEFHHSQLEATPLAEVRTCALCDSGEEQSQETYAVVQPLESCILSFQEEVPPEVFVFTILVLVWVLGTIAKAVSTLNCWSVPPAHLPGFLCFPSFPSPLHPSPLLSCHLFFSPPFPSPPSLFFFNGSRDRRGDSFPLVSVFIQTWCYSIFRAPLCLPSSNCGCLDGKAARMLAS